MKFSMEVLYTIACEEYKNANFIPERDSPAWYDWKAGIASWACISEDVEYESEKALREELRMYIAEEKSDEEENEND